MQIIKDVVIEELCVYTEGMNRVYIVCMQHLASYRMQAMGPAEGLKKKDNKIRESPLLLSCKLCISLF